MVTPHHLAPVLAAAALAVAVGALIVVDRRPVRPLAPSVTEPARTALAPDLPPIAALARYAGAPGAPWRDLNPFIPAPLRAVELAAGGPPLDARRDEAAPMGHREVAPDTAITRSAPEPPQPVTPPPLAVQHGSGPQLVGILRGPRSQRIRLRLDGRTATLTPGQSLAGWRYLSAGAEGALMLDPAGAQHRLQLARR